MKSKLTKIFGVALTLALLTSMLFTAAPATADVGQASVTFSAATEDDISKADAGYIVRFKINKELTGGDATVTAGAGAYSLPDVGDSFTITSTGATDVATLTPGTGTYTITPGTGVTATATVITFSAAGQTATVTATAATTAGTWAQTTGTPAAAITADDNADSFTIAFPAGTDVTGNPAYGIAAEAGWVAGVPNVVAVTTGIVAVANTVAESITFNLFGTTDKIGEGADIRIAFTAGTSNINNPSTAGSYTLTVKTSQETTAVASASYTITTPTITALPGIVSMYNPSGVLMAQDTSGTEINTAMTAGAPFTGLANNFVIKVSPGTYTSALAQAAGITGITIEATGSVAETIIVGNVALTEPSTTLKGFTIKGTVTVTDATSTSSATSVKIDGCIITNATSAAPAATTNLIINRGYVTVQNTELTTATGTAPDVVIQVNETAGTTEAVITGCTLTLGATDVGVNVDGVGAPKTTFTNNTVTGGATSGIGYDIDLAGSTDILTGNTFDGLRTALSLDAASTVTVRGNVVKNSTTVANVVAATATPAIDINSAPAAAGLLIEANDIENNAGLSIDIAAVAATNMRIIGNAFNSNAFGFKNASTTVLDATLNWWGDATGPTITTNASGTGDKITDVAGGAGTTYKPFDTVGTAQISTANLAAAGTIDKSTTVGISFTATGGAANQVTLTQYTGNPAISAPTYSALEGGYYDVYVPAPAGGVTSMTVMFYNANIDANTKAYYYSTLTQKWTACSASAVAGNLAYVIVTITGTSSPTIAEMNGTPFVLVNVPPAPTLTITSPLVGASSVPVMPTLVWGGNAAALSYQLELSEDPTFAILNWSRNVTNAFYSIDEALDYSTTYYWRVKAITGERVVTGDGFFSGSTVTQPSGPFTTGVFTTVAEPVVVEPTTTTQEPPVVNVDVAAPEVTVEPATTSGEAIPSYLLWTIVAIGAVLVIALIVLIVRTRRVA